MKDSFDNTYLAVVEIPALKCEKVVTLATLSPDKKVKPYKHSKQ